MPAVEEGVISSPVLGNSKTSTPYVTLVPWDPDSKEHVDRLFKQRIACGWKSNQVEKWRGLQKEGKIAISWVIFSKDEKEKEAMLAKHVSKYPNERTPLHDSATTLGGHPRTPPNPAILFNPVGHVSLNAEHEDASLVDPLNGLYCVTALYVSGALQGLGLGRAAMDAIETHATKEPLLAKALSLDTMAREHYREEDPIWAARGMSVPKSITHDWYSRRGYDEYARKIGWYEKDTDGNLLPVTAVNMKKSLVG